MSRLGNKPVALPDGVEVSFKDRVLRVKGPKGDMSIPVKGAIDFKLENEPKQVRILRSSTERQERAYHGLYRSLLAGMVVGVTKGYTRELDIVGTGYRAAVEGGVLVLQLGLSHPVRITPPAGVTVTCPSQTQVVITGADKQKVGKLAAEVRRVHPPDPYHGKGLRYRGEVVRKLAGKTFGSTAT